MDYSATTVTAMQQQEGERPTVSSFTPIELTRDLVKAKVLASKTYPDVRRAYPVRLSRKPPPEWKAVFEQQEREFGMDKLPVFIDGALPFETVSANIHRSKNSFEKGTLTEIDKHLAKKQLKMHFNDFQLSLQLLCALFVIFVI